MTNQVIVSGPSTANVLTVGIQGPPGIAGEGVAQVASIVTAVDIGDYLAVSVNASGELILADPTDIDTVVIGITTTGALTGLEATLVNNGRVINPSWTWTVGPVFLGTNGTLTQTTPVTNLFANVGIALDATTLLVDIKQGIWRT